MSQLNMQHLEKMSSEIATNFPQKSSKNKFKFASNSPEDIDHINILNYNPNTNLNKNTGVVENGQNTTNISIDSGIDLTKTFENTFIPDVYTFYGYSIPKNTLYLIIILIIVGIAVWYLTSTHKKKSKNKVFDINDEENVSSSELKEKSKENS